MISPSGKFKTKCMYEMQYTGYRENTSTVPIMVSDGKGGGGIDRDQIMSRKWLVSWTWGWEGLDKEAVHMQKDIQ